MANSSSSIPRWQRPLTPFETARQDYPDAVEALQKIYDLRSSIFLSFVAAYVVKRISGRPYKGVIGGSAAMASFLALQRLNITPAMSAALKESRKEEFEKQQQLKLEKENLHKQLAAAGKKLGDEVNNDGRCLFYAAGVNADEALKLIQEDETVQRAFLRELDDRHDVFKGTDKPNNDDATTQFYCKKMGGKKKNYPFAEAEMMPVIAQLLGRKLRVYQGGLFEDIYPPKNGLVGGKCIEVALVGNHFWPVVNI